MNAKLNSIYLFITDDGKIKLAPLNMSGKNPNPILNPYDGKGLTPFVVEPTIKGKTSAQKAKEKLFPTNNLLRIIANGGKELTIEQTGIFGALKIDHIQGKTLALAEKEAELSLQDLSKLEKALNKTSTPEQISALKSNYEKKYLEQEPSEK